MNAEKIMMSKILLVEDDKEIVENLVVLLREEGFYVTAVRTKKEAEREIEKNRYDLILLDIILPDGNGYSFCTSVSKKQKIPVIMLTAMDDEDSIVTGFELGACDYIAKPFKPMELISRIKNILRLCGKSKTVYQFKNIRVDTRRAAAAKIQKDGEKAKEIPLSALEYRLLLIFFDHQGETLSRSRLLEEIWDIAGDFVNDNTLTVYIKRLREKIEDDPSAPSIIRTVRGIGYRMELS